MIPISIGAVLIASSCAFVMAEQTAAAAKAWASDSAIPTENNTDHFNPSFVPTSTADKPDF
jgi:hypothetical protein